jgi:hypothetical protein
VNETTPVVIVAMVKTNSSEKVYSLFIRKLIPIFLFVVNISGNYFIFFASAFSSENVIRTRVL